MKVFHIAAFTAVTIILSMPAALKHLRSHWLKETIEMIETAETVTCESIQLVQKIADSLQRLENMLMPTNTSPCEFLDPLDVEACRIQTNRHDLQRPTVEVLQYHETQIHKVPGSARPAHSNAKPKGSSDMQVPRWASE